MDDYPDYDETPCPKCGNHTVTKCCNDCGGDGWTEIGELYEQDPLWYDPDDTRPCGECRGRGGFHWCQQCGWDLTEKFYLGWPIQKWNPIPNSPKSLFAK
jgi:hypothetical protein